MRILFCDYLHWVFPRNNNALKDYLREKGVECVDVQPCEIGHCNRNLINPNLPQRKSASSYRGFNIDSFIKVEITMDAKWYNPRLSTIIKYRKWVMYLIDWAFETFEREKPDYIVIEGGLTYLSRPLLEVARELGIKTIAVENSFIKDKIFVDFSGTGYICNRHLFARTSQDWIDTRVLTKTKEKEVNGIISSVFKNLNYKTNGNFDISTLKYKKSVVVPLQVYADQVTLYDSKFNNEQFLSKIFELAKTEFKDWNVILRCHPKEEKWGNNRETGNWIELQTYPENICLIRGGVNSVNTQELIKQADLVFVNNSQAGLEACLLGKPVVVFGDAFYANKGFTFEYNDCLNWKKIKSYEVNIEHMKKVKLWFYYFYKFLYDKQLTETNKLRISKELNLQ